MTVLSAAQDAGILLLGRKPNSLFSTDVFGLELGELANEAAIAIAEYYDWQKLKILKTYAGDGAAIAFDLPTDYGRMLRRAKLHSLDLEERQLSPGARRGRMAVPAGHQYLRDARRLDPARRPDADLPADAGRRDRAALLHFEEHRGAAAGAAGKDGFHARHRRVRAVNERLLTLALMWRWRSLKRMEYSEDMANYEIALAEEVAKDKGTRGSRRRAQRLGR
jgi:hypothetical protein